MTRAVTVHGFKHKTRKPSREAPVLAACLQVLRLRGIFHWRNNTGCIVQVYKGRKRIVRFGAPGSPDIIGILPGGRFLGVEVKPPLGPKGGGKKQTDDQIEFERAVRAAGGRYILARSGTELDEMLGEPNLTMTVTGGGA